MIIRATKKSPKTLLFAILDVLVRRLLLQELKFFQAHDFLCGYRPVRLIYCRSSYFPDARVLSNHFAAQSCTANDSGMHERHHDKATFLNRKLIPIRQCLWPVRLLMHLKQTLLASSLNIFLENWSSTMISPGGLCTYDANRQFPVHNRFVSLKKARANFVIEFSDFLNQSAGSHSTNQKSRTSCGVAIIILPLLSLSFRRVGRSYDRIYIL